MSRNDILCCLVVILPKSAGSGQLVALCNDTLLYCDRAWLKWWQYTLYVAFHIYICIYMCVCPFSWCIMLYFHTCWLHMKSEGPPGWTRMFHSSMMRQQHPSRLQQFPVLWFASHGACWKASTGSPGRDPRKVQEGRDFLIIFQTANQWFSHRNVCENHVLPILWPDGDITILNKYVYIYI